MDSVVNVHPAFVHFPIALLFLYAVMEIVQLEVFTRYLWWSSVKRAFLFFGVPFAYMTIITGFLAAEAYAGSSIGDVIAVHKKFAFVIAAIFTLLALLHIFAIRRQAWAERFVNSPLVSLVALAGLLCLFVVGSLGASIVYGPAVDPIVEFIYNIVFPAA